MTIFPNKKISLLLETRIKIEEKMFTPRIIFHTVNYNVTFILLLRNSKPSLQACLSKNSRRHARRCYFSLMPFSLWMTLKWEVSC